MAADHYNVASYRKALKAARKAKPPCSICGLPIKGSGPHRASIDHIRRAADFPPGTPATVISAPSNLRPVGLVCNLKRRKPGRRSRSAGAWRNRRY